MEIEYLAGFLLLYTGTACLVTVLCALFGKGPGRWLRVAVTLLLFGGGIAAASAALAGRNSVVYVLLNTARFERNYVAAVGAGVFSGLLAGFALQGFAASRWQRFLGMAAHLGAVVFFSAIVLKSTISLYLPEPGNADGALVEQQIQKGFRIEEYAQLSILPTSIAIGPEEPGYPLGRLYAAGYSGVAYQHGVIVRLDPSSPTGKVKEVRVVDYLNRPHGLAFHGRDLYVSHAGQYTKAEQGKIRQLPTGTITRLRDLTGDGKFDYHEDIISDLPGAQLPDGLHQNNGIAFDSAGYLYVGVGTPSDHGPATRKYAGTILRINPETKEVKVFAKGLRNPFGITLGPFGQIYCTDNDANNKDIGDGLFRVTEGAHLGHPFVALEGNIRVMGIAEPLLRSKPAIEGIAYAPSGSFSPGYDDCLYVASYGNGHVNRVKITRQIKRHKEEYAAEMSFFASIPGALDVVISPHEKAMYVCSHEKRKIYRITPE
jgi:glucose/arabinose dehydrogenase